MRALMAMLSPASANTEPPHLPTWARSPSLLSIDPPYEARRDDASARKTPEGQGRRQAPYRPQVGQERRRQDPRPGEAPGGGARATPDARPRIDRSARQADRDQ